ncbi:rhomboid domain-containing protein 2-like isoform X2 [Carcharodon carcharias]|uniref:rhomboid domain-containing protein 2-like isoform X2 n=1 Tax=Carcharodon carcharias TaxID=13397 RepID=UPI001B7EFD12|nr:rhomboid domain-containing protein 2-like isoform X2 [Carcharodon carcharias]
MADRRGEQPPRPGQQQQPPSLVQMVKSMIPVLPCATVSTALLGWIIFYLTCRFKVFDEHTFTLGHLHSRLQVYKLLSYMFIHKSMSALVCNVLILWYFGGALEKNIGTVKYAYLTLLFTVLAGIIYALIGSIFFGLQNLKEIQGFTVVVFAYVGMSVFLSPMKHIVFITTIKLVYLPFILLVIAIFIPESSIVDAYGRRYFPYLDLHEMTAASLERYFPFNRLKDIPGITFYSALWEVRNVEVTDRCNPKPGSYPTQTYYFPPATDSQCYQYSQLVKEQTHWFGLHQQSPSYGVEYTSRSKYDVGLGHSHDLSYTSQHGHNHYVGHTFGHGHSHDLGHTSGHGHSHDLESNPGHVHICDHKRDYQYTGKIPFNSPVLQQSYKNPAVTKHFEGSCSVVVN